jgi:hypothetical protein
MVEKYKNEQKTLYKKIDNKFREENPLNTQIQKIYFNIV